MCSILCADDLKEVIARIEKISPEEINAEAVNFAGLNNFELIKSTEKKYFFGNIIIQQASSTTADELVQIKTPTNKKGEPNDSALIGGGLMANLGDNITLEDVLISNIEVTGSGQGLLTIYGIGYWLHF